MPLKLDMNLELTLVSMYIRTFWIGHKVFAFMMGVFSHYLQVYTESKILLSKEKTFSKHHSET